MWRAGRGGGVGSWLGWLGSGPWREVALRLLWGGAAIQGSTVGGCRGVSLPALGGEAWICIAEGAASAFPGSLQRAPARAFTASQSSWRVPPAPVRGLFPFPPTSLPPPRALTRVARSGLLRRGLLAWLRRLCAGQVGLPACQRDEDCDHETVKEGV